MSIMNEKIGYPIRHGVRQPVRASQKRRPSPLRRSDTSQTSAAHDILYAELDGDWFAFLGQLGSFSAVGPVNRLIIFVFVIDSSGCIEAARVYGDSRQKR